MPHQIDNQTNEETIDDSNEEIVHDPVHDPVVLRERRLLMPGNDPIRPREKIDEELENAEELKKLFRDLVTQSGWSQSETARQLGCSSSHVNMIMKGKTTPGTSLLLLLEMIVKEAKNLNLQARRLLARVMHLPEAQQKKALEFLRNLLDTLSSSKLVSMLIF
jgi:transcriptional regulator with XRE-family HTH domain